MKLPSEKFFAWRDDTCVNVWVIPGRLLWEIIAIEGIFYGSQLSLEPGLW
jgi:hypothetical protein